MDYKNQGWNWSEGKIIGHYMVGGGDIAVYAVSTETICT